MKNAKKSMFITTILMVAVLIVAVSTATFAWYTSASTLEAAETTISSAASSSANIAITDDAAEIPTTNSVSITLSGAGDVLPMVPTAKIAVGATEIAYETAPITLAGIFTKDGDTATPWVSKTFYVVNNNINNAVSVDMTATFGAGADVDLSANLCVAVFVNDEVAGVFANKVYYYGEIEKDGVALEENGSLTACEASDIINPSTGKITINDIPAKDGSDNFAEITVYAWIDGADLASTNAAMEVAAFSFDFAEAQA